VEAMAHPLPRRFPRLHHSAEPLFLPSSTMRAIRAPLPQARGARSRLWAIVEGFKTAGLIDPKPYLRPARPHRSITRPIASASFCPGKYASGEDRLAERSRV
jgi:hypothetical protein